MPMRRDDLENSVPARKGGLGDARDESSMLAQLAQLPVLLASAPHRLMFFAGASAVVISMLWWACFLAASYSGHSFPMPSVPAGWAHAVFTQFGMLPLFIFGFLLTVFPRWMGQPALTRRAYAPVFIGVFGGYLLAHVGLLGMKWVLVAGVAMMLTGWVAALTVLGVVLRRNRAKDRHALSCYLALVLGACGLASFGAFTLGAPPQLALLAIKVGTFGLLLPIFFTVCHRMIPFFSASVIGAGYRVVKPSWSLGVLWVLLFVHLGLELTHHIDWFWVVDGPLAILFLGHWLAWQPWKCMRPGLLAVLHVAFVWLPIAFALYTTQSFIDFAGGGFLLGRAPVHALTVGFFGSMLVAMVTRVTQGHSGRPLQMGAVPWLTFALLQGVAFARVYAGFADDAPRWLLIAAFGWLVAFLPWVVRSLWIFTTPRTDGRPG
jgi:uncharacterized protein involved in response to NO